MSFEINVRFAARHKGISKRPNKRVNRMNFVLPENSEDLPFNLFQKLARAFKKITMDKRKTRAALAKAMTKSHKNPVSIEKFVDLQPKFEEMTPTSVESEVTQGLSVEPVLVLKTTTMPLCAADQTTPVDWYQCSQCALVFNSIEMMSIHHLDHRNRNREGRKVSRLTESASAVKEPVVEAVSVSVKESPFKIPSLPGFVNETVSVSDKIYSEVPPQDPLERSISPTTLRESILKRNGTAADLQCSICNSIFSSRRDLKRHMSRHNETEKSIHLGGSHGKKAFEGQSSMEEDDSPYDDCEFPDFKKASAFVCVYCQKQFGFENSLKRHLKTHSIDDSTLTRKSKMFAGDSKLRSTKSSNCRLPTSKFRAGSVAKNLSNDRINLNSYSPISL